MNSTERKARELVIEALDKMIEKYKKTSYIEIDGKELVGDNSLTKVLYQRQLCGVYSNDLMIYE